MRSVIHLQDDAGAVQLDARPSDALNLAVQHQDIDALERGQWRDLSPNLISELRDVAAA